MTRQERIYQYMVENTMAVQSADAMGNDGLTTAVVASSLQIARPNVSKELNDLVRQGKLLKSTGRPVQYCVALIDTLSDTSINSRDTQEHESGFAQTIKHADEEIKSEPQLATVSQYSDDLLTHMIGGNSSMHNQIEQAKAAMLYPPRGLNTLIIGPTGSGKTFFANAMFEYTKSQKLMPEVKELITFNCADYAHNPELLMSHLFGYTKGSFTGANDDQEGLIQEADGGMLFLDEVHRLPPEGQEMIFYFMDHGTYSRLGETAKTHHANVRLVCATTEDPESSLLQTFVRRIPITIQLPPFNKRSPQERIELLRSLLTIEANRTNKQITLTEDVVQALLGSVTYGNVGQLKSNVQLVCAQGFLNNIDNEDEIVITSDKLPSNIKDGLLHLASDRRELGEISKLLQPYMTIKPDSKRSLPVNHNDSYELPYNLYEIIGDKATMLREEGLDQEHINNFITTDINLHLKSFYKEDAITQSTENKLAEIVDSDIIEFSKEIQPQIESKLNYQFRDNFIYAMSLHISSFIKRIQSGKPMRLMGNDLVAMVKDYPDELEVANTIKEQLEERYNMPIPESESYYLAILIISLKMAPSKGNVGIVVAAHGSSTASSMVQVVSQLLSDNSVESYDMPLDVDPQVAYRGIVEKVRDANQGNGVLLLVDMGSLSTFAPKITEETQIPVQVIDMVTTAMVLEATRKASFIESDLNGIYSELREFHGYSRVASSKKEIEDDDADVKRLLPDKPKAVIAICSTGEGTAQRIKNLLDQLLVQNLIEDVKIIPISIVNMKERITEINKQYTVIAATGVMDPEIGVPFMALQSLLQGGGEQFVHQLVERSEVAWVTNIGNTEVSKEVCRKYLSDYFMFINPDKFTSILWNYVGYLEEQRHVKFNDPFKISLIMHLGGAVERALTNTAIPATEDEISEIQGQEWLKLVQNANHEYLDKVQITLTSSEEFYIYKLLETWQEKNDTMASDTLVQ